jgi:hypothetical protein
MPLSIMIDRKSSQADGLGMNGRLFCAYHQAQYRELQERETQLMGWSAAETVKCRVRGQEAFHETSRTGHRFG